MPDAPPSLGRALFLWLVLSVVFVVGGGVGAGVTALLYEWIFGDQFGNTLYAVIFGGFGLIAYRTARTYAEARMGRGSQGPRRSS